MRVKLGVGFDPVRANSIGAPGYPIPIQLRIYYTTAVVLLYFI
jgi:hypothetical protein